MRHHYRTQNLIYRRQQWYCPKTNKKASPYAKSTKFNWRKERWLDQGTTWK